MTYPRMNLVTSALEGGEGRATLRASGIKLELLGSERIPVREDSCIKAFVRLLARDCATV